VDANSPAHAGDYIRGLSPPGWAPVSNPPPTGGGSGGVTLVVRPDWRSGRSRLAACRLPAVFFAGLAPGFVGLYQVNVQVPQGVAAGDAVPVVLSTGAAASNPVTIAVR
jgi:uncharacterized protein (TIGR03437 family)